MPYMVPPMMSDNTDGCRHFDASSEASVRPLQSALRSATACERSWSGCRSAGPSPLEAVEDEVEPERELVVVVAAADAALVARGARDRRDVRIGGCERGR